MSSSEQEKKPINVKKKPSYRADRFTSIAGNLNPTKMAATGTSVSEAQHNNVACPACNKVIDSVKVISLCGCRKEDEDTAPPRCEPVIVATCICLSIVITMFGLLQVGRLTLLSILTHLELKSSTSDRTNIDILLNVTSQSVYVLEYPILIHGLMLLSHYCRNKDNKPLKICKTVIKGVPHLCHLTLCDITNRLICCCCVYSDDTGSETLNECQKISYLVVVVLIVVIILEPLHIAATMVAPAFLVHWKNETIPFFYTNEKIATHYEHMALADHVYTVFTRSAMAFVTLFVMSAWTNAEDKIKTKAEERVKNKQDLDEKMTSELVDILAKKYHKTGTRVNAVQNVFQGWFVIKWVIYFIDIVGHSILAAEILFDKHRSERDNNDSQLKYVLTHLGYDFFAFFFLFICGAFMNHYHDKYRKTQAKVQREILSKSSNSNTSIMQYSDTLISEVPEYQFLPSIFWIDFPLNSPGYTLTMLLALFAFIANFLTQYDYKA